MVARDQTALVKSAWEVEVMLCSRIYFVQDIRCSGLCCSELALFG